MLVKTRVEKMHREKLWAIWSIRWSRQVKWGESWKSNKQSLWDWEVINKETWEWAGTGESIGEIHMRVNKQRTVSTNACHYSAGSWPVLVNFSHTVWVTLRTSVSCPGDLRSGLTWCSIEFIHLCPFIFLFWYY